MEIPKQIAIDTIGRFELFDYEAEGDDAEPDSLIYEREEKTSDGRSFKLVLTGIDLTTPGNLASFQKHASATYLLAKSKEESFLNDYKKEIIEETESFDSEVTDYSILAAVLSLSHISIYPHGEGFSIWYHGGNLAHHHDLDCEFRSDGSLDYLSYQG